MRSEGRCHSRFSAVRDAFEANLAEGLEQGAAFAVVLDGRVAVDLWGGHADAAGERPWSRDTLVNVWSTTKGVVALAMAMLTERGALDYEAPVARYWPEFAANGKERITVECLLSHQAGLSGCEAPMTLEDLYRWDPYVTALADMAPLWPPGDQCVYHALTYGHLAGEILRRVDGRSMGGFVAEEIAGPLGVDFYIGLPESHDARVAETVAGPGADQSFVEAERRPLARGYLNPRVRVVEPNERAWRAAEVPAGNGHGDALGLARLYGAMARGGTIDAVRLIGAEALAAATAERYRGLDAAFGWPIRFAAGFMLNEMGGFGPSPGAFGHTGLGGSYAFADPEARVGVAHVMNRLLGFGEEPDPRRVRLLEAFYAAL